MYKKIYKNMCFLSLVTLFLSAFMIFSAVCSAFGEHTKKDMKDSSETLSLLLESQIEPLDFEKNTKKLFEGKSIKICSPDGKYVFLNEENTDRFNQTIGETMSAASSSGSAEYEVKSFFGFNNFFCTAKKTASGYTLCVYGKTFDFFEAFAGASVVIILLAAFIFLLSFSLAARLTKNIVSPIENLCSFDDASSLDAVCPEIRPFIAGFAAQNNEIKRQIEKISSQKIRLQAITDNMNEGLIVFDRHKKISMANTCVCELFSAIESSVKHRELTAITKNERLAFALEEAFKGKKNNLITEINDKSFQVFYSPVYKNNAINSVVMLLFDVSEKYEAEKIRREFSANVSHELKTPLTAIHGYAQIINNGIAKPEDIKSFTKKIEKESSRLITLIEDIIKLSSLDESDGKYEKQNISLQSVCAEVLDTLSSKVQEKNISAEIIGEDTCVFANPSQITELIYNLLDNAIKYNKENGRVWVEIWDSQIKICDTGIGISEEYYERIFERFFRIDKSRSKKVNGTGLGLSIVKHIAKTNNAQISVKSRLGEGTEFTVTFDKTPSL